MIRFHSITGLPRAAPGLYCAAAIVTGRSDNDPVSSPTQPTIQQKFVIYGSDTASTFATKIWQPRAPTGYDFNEFTRNLRRRRQ
jgi:hypothetical protein